MKRDERFNLEVAEKYYKEGLNITDSAKKHCKDIGAKYSEMYRHALSRHLIRKGEPKKITVKESNAKILLIDIETSMISFYGFSPYNKFVQSMNLIDDWFLLTTSAKWLFDDEMHSFKLTEEELLNHNDKRLTEHIWKMLDEATHVIAYNGVKFDVPKMNAKFFEHRLGLPSPYKVIDPFVTVKRMFNLTYNSLDHVLNLLGLEGKMENEKGLWQKVMKGDMNALNNMSTYNNKDVQIMEDLYLEIRPYIRSHPNIGLHIVEDVCGCPTCGSENVEFGKGTDYFTQVNRFRTFKCTDCGSWGRERKPLKIENKNLTMPIAGL